MSDQSAPIVGGQSALSADQASRLLRIGLADPSRPSDPLLERLALPDGAQWLTNVIAAGPFAACCGPEALFSPETFSLDQLRDIKERCTERALYDTSDDRMAAMASYFIAVAAGLAHFRTNLSSRTPGELQLVFLELAAVTPSQWADIFTKANAVLSESH